VTVEPSRIELLELDIDMRISELWGLATMIERWDIATAATFMRSAYGVGYSDALRERPGERGKLCVDNGYQVPE
jgi:hypothetical protein